MRVELTSHMRRRLSERDIRVSDIATVWLSAEIDLPSADHAGARVRTATTPSGRRLAVVAIDDGETLTFISSWEVGVP